MPLLTDATDSGPAPSIVSLADILSGKVDLDDDAFDEGNEEPAVEGDAEETSDVSYFFDKIVQVDLKTFCHKHLLHSKLIRYTVCVIFRTKTMKQMLILQWS
jgi:hypothetical protein